MIAYIDIEVNAANPQMPLGPFFSFVGSPANVRVKNVPGSVGSWDITAVSIAYTTPDNAITTVGAVNVDGCWVATLPASTVAGRCGKGLQVIASGTDENGVAVTGYVLGAGDVEILPRDGTAASAGVKWYFHYLEEVPAIPHTGDVCAVDGVLQYYDGTTWRTFADAGIEVVAPSTDSADEGKAADAYETGTSLAGKADKVANATAGNLAALDANGDLADSGKALGDIALAASLAPAFVLYNAYEVGDLCTSFDADSHHYGTWLYKCILATDGSLYPESDSTHWALATVDDMLAALRTAVAGKQDALSAAQIANIAAVPNKADASALRYTMPASVALVAENDAATLVCADRAVTNATIATGFSTLNLTFPAAVSGYVRDFYLRITVAAGVSAPAISVPQGVTIENAGGAVPEIADGEASAAATLVWFSETAPGVFTAKSETVSAVA